MAVPRTCDQETHLYTLTYTEHRTFDGFWLEKVPTSNLVLLVIDDLLGTAIGDVDLDFPTPKEIVYHVQLECVRAGGEGLVRRSYTECFNEVIVEDSDIKICSAVRAKARKVLLCLLSLMVAFF